MSRGTPRPTCAECGTYARGVKLNQYSADDHHRERRVVLRLCERCQRDPGAAWRSRWTIRGGYTDPERRARWQARNRPAAP